MNKIAKISILIINYNGLKHLEYCLPTIYAQKYEDFEIIIVDNNSHDGSVEFLNNNFPEVKVIKSDKNLGFAAANNVAFEKSSGDLILLLNNDTKLTQDSLRILVEEMGKNEKIGVIQPKILFMDKPEWLDSVGCYLTSSGILNHFGRRKNHLLPKYNKKDRFYSLKGACMMMPRKVVEEVGLFDDDYFAYFEETDFCHRVWLAGYECWYCPEAVIYHKMGATSKRLNNSFIQFHSFKNRIRTYVKNLGKAELIKILPVHLLLCFLVSWVYLFIGRPGVFVAIYKAIFWNIANIKATVQKRRHVQKDIRRVPDRAFMPIIKKNVKPSYFYHLFFGLKNYED